MNTLDVSSFFMHPKKGQVPQCWLILGVLALGVAGVFAGLLANTHSAFFYTALVVHVDLSVLIWFLTIECMFFSMLIKHAQSLYVYTFFGCVSVGTLLLVGSAFAGGEAFMSNYVPVIHHPLFFFALSLICCGVLGMVLLLLATEKNKVNPISVGIMSTGQILAFSFICLFGSTAYLNRLSAPLQGQVYYEYLFWSGGHILQIAHTQAMMVCWLLLATASSIRIRFSDKLLNKLFLFGFLSAIGGFLIDVVYGFDVTNDDRRAAFTALMRHVNGIAPILMGGMLLFQLMKHSWSKQQRLFQTTLLMSLLLFVVGGGLGYMIHGSNVIVPAHYHGSIVGVTLAFMGLAYLLLPYWGFKDVSGSIWALIQPIIYGGGQLCWMTGMAILGAHGVPRKTPGSADTVGVLASVLKHSGDGLALIGGLLFVIIMLRATIFQKKKVVI